MNIGLIGYGKMGKRIAEIACQRGHTISAIIDPFATEKTAEALTADTVGDVFIDFTTPDSIMNNIGLACAYNKNLVVGTTGWNVHFAVVKTQVEAAKIGFIWASSFSPAVQMFFRVAREAAHIANAFPECDVAAWEAHHRHKIDAPSGTAMTLGKILLEAIDRKTELLLDRPPEKIADNQLHLASLRAGEIPGTHCVLFDFPAETIEVKVTSRSRDGYALGAVLAAEWLQGKTGFFDFAEVFGEMVRK